MSYENYAPYGGSNRTRYDRCAYQQELYQSTSPFAYRMYEGAYENCKKCTSDNKFYRPFDGVMVDTESELKGITRPVSRCPQFKYNPECKKSGLCTSTFDASVPVVPDPSVCPDILDRIYGQNIPRTTSKGYTLPGFSCGK